MNDKTKLCSWIINSHSPFQPIVFCFRPATHYCQQGGAQYCEDHAEDYSDVFGDDSLKEIPIEETK